MECTKPHKIWRAIGGKLKGEIMKNPYMLGGVTLPSEYATALRDWRRERDFRKDRIDNAREDGMTEEEIAINPNLPLPRGWWEYAVDPRMDGAPTSENSDAPGKLDRASDLNTDALVLTPWWAEQEAGMDTRAIIEYQQMLKSEIDNFGSWVGYYADEAWTPDIYIRTSMADYVPNMFNIFMDEDGDRLDPSKTAGFWSRTGQTLGQGVAGYAIAGGMIFVGLMFAPKAVERTSEMVEKVVTGTFETLFGIQEEYTKSRMRRRQIKEAITGD